MSTKTGIFLVGILSFSLSFAAFAAQTSSSQNSQMNLKLKKIADRNKQTSIASSTINKGTKSAVPSLQPTASTSSGNTTAKAAKPAAAPASGWTGMLGVTRNNSLYLKKDETDRSSFDFEGVLGYKWNKDWLTASRVIYTHDLVNPDNNNELGLASLAVRYFGFQDPKEDRSLFTPSLLFGIPVNKGQKFASFRGSVGTSAKFALNPAYAISKKLNLYGVLIFTRNIHDFTTNEAGKTNNQYALTQSGVIGWSFTESLDVKLNLSHYDTITYLNERKDYYSHSQEIAYGINKNFEVTLGHSLGAPYMPVNKPSGEGSNFVLTDEEQSSVYLGLGAQF
jgi:hypothetical protein